MGQVWSNPPNGAGGSWDLVGLKLRLISQILSVRTAASMRHLTKAQGLLLVEFRIRQPSTKVMEDQKIFLALSCSIRQPNIGSTSLLRIIRTLQRRVLLILCLLWDQADCFSCWVVPWVNGSLTGFDFLYFFESISQQ